MPARVLVKAEFLRILVRAECLLLFILAMILCLLTKGESLVKRRENSTGQGHETLHSWAVGYSALLANSHLIYGTTRQEIRGVLNYRAHHK